MLTILLTAALLSGSPINVQECGEHSLIGANKGIVVWYGDSGSPDLSPIGISECSNLVWNEYAGVEEKILCRVVISKQPNTKRVTSMNNKIIDAHISSSLDNETAALTAALKITEGHETTDRRTEIIQMIKSTVKYLGVRQSIINAIPDYFSETEAQKAAKLYLLWRSVEGR